MNIIKVTNLVATANLEIPLRLERVAVSFNALYDPESYHCAYIRDEKMYGKVSLFVSGKMISIGTKSEKEARSDLNYVARLLSDAGFNNKRRVRATIQNIVANADLGVEMDLDRLSKKVPGMAFEPETFSGAIYKPLEFPGTVLIFASGKLVIVGCKTRKQIEDIYSHMKSLID